MTYKEKNGTATTTANENKSHNNIVSSDDNSSLASSNSNHSVKSSHQVQGIPFNDAESAILHESATRNSADSVNPKLARTLTKVPVNQRRGLLAFVTIIPEYHDARDYERKTKCLLVFVVAFAAICGPMNTLILLPAIDDISKDLHTTNTIVNVSVGIYLLALGIFPLWFSTLSEKVGRRTVYIISFTIFICFSIGSALSPNIASLIILRFFAGCGGSAVQAVGAGTISDLFAPHERGQFLGLFYLGPLLGPFIAPVLGGAVSLLSWRATQWTMSIFCGVSLFLIILLLPETLRKEDIELIRRIRNEVDKQKSGINESEETDDSEKQRDDTSKQRTHRDDSDAEIERIASRLSRQSTRRQNEILEYDETPAIDPLMPTLSRLTSEKSSYSRKVQKDFYDHLDQLNESKLRNSDKLSQNENDKSFNEKNPQHNQRHKLKGFMTSLYDFFIRPTHSIILLTYPPIALLIAYSSICFAGVYFFNMTISYEYAKEPYNFSNIIVGLMYIPNSITYVCASVIGGRWNDHLLMKHAKTHNGELVPESRIAWNVITAVVIFPPACLIFGWCLDYGEFWVTPLIGTALFGFASMLIIGTTVTYLTDLLPGRGATGVAINNLIRQILAAIATFVVEPLLKALGPGVLFSIIMGVMSFAAFAMLYLKKYGAYYREHYDITEYYNKL